MVNVTTKHDINLLSDLSGNMRKPQKCDGEMDGRADETDGWARPFCCMELITIVVIDIGLSKMFDLR